MTKLLQEVAKNKWQTEASEKEVRTNYIDKFITIEEDLLSVLEDAYTDRHLYQCTTTFRAAQKQIDSGYFKAMMTSHEKFK